MISGRFLVLAAVFMFFCSGRPCFAQCDTVGGMPAQAARRALEGKNVDIALAWVQLKQEAEVRDAFEKAIAAAKSGPAAKELAGEYFVETVVRLHCASEGKQFSGLRPQETVSQAVIAAELALASGSTDNLAKELSGLAASGVRERFSRVLQAKGHSEEDIEAGRAYARAYEEYIYYVERLSRAVGDGESTY
jgi:hypothetical protein